MNDTDTRFASAIALPAVLALVTVVLARAGGSLIAGVVAAGCAFPVPESGVAALALFLGAAAGVVVTLIVTVAVPSWIAMPLLFDAVATALDVAAPFALVGAWAVVAIGHATQRRKREDREE